MFRWVARMLAVAALAPLALPAHAAADQTVTASGSLTYTWQGDPARGCAAVGLCGVQGALILKPQGSVGVSGPRRGPIELPLQASGGAVRVSDGAGAGECVDVPSVASPGASLVFATGPGGGLVGHIESSLSSGRCAGPIQRDLAALALPVRRSGAAFDLSGSQAFAAGPFSGTLVSTLVVKTGSGGGGSGTSSVVSLGSTPVSVPTRKVFVERMTLRYRIASLPGALDVSFQGEPDPFCAALDSCGASGSLALSLAGFRPTLVVQASRTVSGQVDARQVLADFRRGLLAPQGGASSRAGAAVNVSETFSGSGPVRCEDTAQTQQANLSLLVGGAGPSGRASVALSNETGSGLLRTYCPGPSDSDAFGNSQIVARTSIGVAQLMARRSVISLTAPGGFAGFGYVGSRSGALRFSMTLERVQALTVEETRP